MKLVDLPLNATQADILMVLATSAVDYLEVGVQEGRSLHIVLTNGSRTLRSLTLCDSWGSESGGSGRGSHQHIEELLAKRGWKGYTTFLDGDSRQVLASFATTVGNMHDLVHIDGGHGAEVVASDLAYGWELCSGHMVVHDISMHDVWSELFKFLQTVPHYEVELRIFIGGHGTAVLSRCGVAK